MYERGARRQQCAHRAAGEVHGLREPFGSELRQSGPRPRAAQSAHHDLVVVDPLEVHETVGEGRAELPSVGRRRARVGGGHDPYVGRQSQCTDAPLQYETEQSGLHGRRGGRQFVEEQQAAARSHQAHGPVRRRHRDALFRGIVTDDGEPREVGRLVHAGDHRGQWKVQRHGELGEGGALADPRLAPEQDGQVGCHGQGEGLQMDVGARFGGGVAQQGHQLAGDGQLGVGRENLRGADGRGRGAYGHG